MSADGMKHKVKVDFEINWYLAGKEFSHLDSCVQAGFFKGFIEGCNEIERSDGGFLQMLYVADELSYCEQQKLEEIFAGLAVVQ